MLAAAGRDAALWSCRPRRDAALWSCRPRRDAALWSCRPRRDAALSPRPWQAVAVARGPGMKGVEDPW